MHKHAAFAHLLAQPSPGGVPPGCQHFVYPRRCPRAARLVSLVHDPVWGGTRWGRGQARDHHAGGEAVQGCKLRGAHARHGGERGESWWGQVRVGIGVRPTLCRWACGALASRPVRCWVTGGGFTTASVLGSVLVSGAQLAVRGQTVIDP